MANDEFKKGEALKPFSKDLGPEDKTEIKEFSTFNQAALIFNRQDKLLSDVHNLIFEARKYDPNAVSLKDVYHALRSAIAPSKAALHGDDREKIENALKRFVRLLTEFDKIKHGREPTIEEGEKYWRMHETVYEILELLYNAQQKINMGIPKERGFSSKERITKAVKE